MEDQFDNTLVSEIEGKSKRPRFLTVLCVLSFIWAGLAIAAGVMGQIYNTPENMRANIEQVRAQSPARAAMMEKGIERQENSVMGKIQNYLLILIEVISVLGVIMMFNLNKVGFYIYAAIEILPYSMLFFGDEDSSMDMGMGPGATKAFGIIFVLIDVGFVVMYGLNLKHMKGQVKN